MVLITDKPFVEQELIALFINVMPALSVPVPVCQAPAVQLLIGSVSVPV